MLCLWLLLIDISGVALLKRIVAVQTKGWEQIDDHLQVTRKSILESELILWLRQNKLPGEIIVFGTTRVEEELIFYYSENRTYRASVDNFEKILTHLLNKDSQAFIVIFDVPIHDLQPHWFQKHEQLQKREPAKAVGLKPGGFTIPPASLPPLRRKDILIEEIVHFPEGAIYQARLTQ